MNFTAEDKHREIIRELGYRRRLYPRWVAEGRMKQQQCDQQIAIMQAIADDYAKQVAEERLT